MKKLLILVFSVALLQSCSFLRKTTKNNINELSKKDSSFNSSLKIDSSNKKIETNSTEGNKSNKSTISFIVDTSKKPTVINNYIQPSGNSSLDFIKWLAQNNLLKSGSIENSSDSTYKALNSILNENKLLKEKLDSAKSSEVNSKNNIFKFTEKTVNVSVFSIIIFIVIAALLYIIYRHFKTNFSIVKIVKNEILGS